MPSSTHFHISKMVDWIVRLQPTSVLDIGVGFGKWGFLAREYTDINAHHYKREDWTVRIEGVEAFPEYATPTYPYIYDKIHYGDLRTRAARPVHVRPGHHRRRDRTLRQRGGSGPAAATAPEIAVHPAVVADGVLHARVVRERVRAAPEFVDGARFQRLSARLRRIRAVGVRGVAARRPAGGTEVHLDGKVSRLVYGQPLLKKHPKAAFLAKSVLDRLI